MWSRLRDHKSRRTMNLKWEFHSSDHASVRIGRKILSHGIGLLIPVDIARSVRKDYRTRER